MALHGDRPEGRRGHTGGAQAEHATGRHVHRGVHPPVREQYPGQRGGADGRGQVRSDRWSRRHRSGTVRLVEQTAWVRYGQICGADGMVQVRTVRLVEQTTGVRYGQASGADGRGQVRSG